MPTVDSYLAPNGAGAGAPYGADPKVNPSAVLPVFPKEDGEDPKDEDLNPFEDPIPPDEDPKGDDPNTKSRGGDVPDEFG